MGKGRVAGLADKSWWCWVVLAGTFYVSFTVDGYSFAFGILKLAIEHEHDGVISKESIAIIGGLIPALYCLLAPIAFGLVGVFSIRTLTICGAILSSIGFVLAFANQYLQWGFALDLISLGVIQGTASALLYGPSINLIPSYFTVERKALATGVTTCGSPAGAIIYGFLMHELIEAFSWRGSMLFWAFAALMISFAGLTFLPKQQQQSPDDDDNGDDDDDEVKSSNDKLTTKVAVFDMVAEDEDDVSTMDNGSSIKFEGGVIGSGVEFHKSETSPSIKPLLPSDSSNDSSMLGVGNDNNDDDDVYYTTKKSNNNKAKEQNEQKKTSTMEQLKREFKMIFNWELFSDYRFITLLIAMAFSILGYYVPTLLVTGQAKEPAYGVSPRVQKYLIWLWGIANLLGRLFVGWLADMGRYTPLCSSLSLFVVGLLLSSVCVLVFPHVMIYGDVAFISFVVIYGFVSAPFITLRSTIVQDLYYDKKEQIASSFGWTLWAEGLVIVGGFYLPSESFFFSFFFIFNLFYFFIF